MLPLIYRFTFETNGQRIFGLLVVLALAAYRAWAHWAQATEKGEKDAKPAAIRTGIITFTIGAVVVFIFPTIAKAFKFNGIPIHTYGVLVGSGFLTAITVATWIAPKEWPGATGRLRRDQILDLAPWLFGGAILGSKLLFVIVNWKDYAGQPAKIFDLSGGLVVQGGIIGASSVSYWYAKKHGIEFARLADIAMPTISLGQAFGRLGCFSAGCCWGRATTEHMPLAVRFPGPSATNIIGDVTNMPSLTYGSQEADSRFFLESTGQVLQQMQPGAVKISDWVREHGHSLPVHPTQLYEASASILFFLFLLLMRNYRRFHGQIAGMWLMGYAIIRSTVETFRGDLERGTLHGTFDFVPVDAWYNVSTGQVISIAMFALGVAILIRGYRSMAKPTELSGVAVGA